MPPPGGNEETPAGAGVFLCWGTWTRTKNNGTRNRRVANYTIPQRAEIASCTESRAYPSGGGTAKPATEFFGIHEPELEAWNFTWYEDLFAADADTPDLVNVASKAYRRVALYEPGEYEATLYYNGTSTTANWLVRDIDEVRKTKNVLLFIGDGMTTNMITAARLIAHQTINGKYQSLMAMDQFPVLGHQVSLS